MSGRIAELEPSSRNFRYVRVGNEVRVGLKTHLGLAADIFGVDISEHSPNEWREEILRRDAQAGAGFLIRIDPGEVMFGGRSSSLNIPEVATEELQIEIRDRDREILNKQFNEENFIHESELTD